MFSELIQEYIDKGFTLIPLAKNNQPLIKWEFYQSEDPTQRQYEVWFEKEVNVGVINGSISNNLFSIDIDKPGFEYELFPKFDLLLEKTYIDQTPSGGVHIYFRNLEGIVENRTIFYINEQNKEHELFSVRSTGRLTTLPPSKKENGIYKQISKTKEILIFESANDFEENMFKVLQANFPDLIPQWQRSSTNINSQFDIPEQLDQSLQAVMNSNIRMCIKELIVQMDKMKNHHTHEKNQAIGRELYANGFTEEAVQKVFGLATGVDLRRAGRPFYSEKKTHEQFSYIVRKQKHPYKCATLMSFPNTCLGSICPFFENANRKLKENT